MRRLGSTLLLIGLACTLASCGRPRGIDVTPSPGYDYAAVVAGIVRLHVEADEKWLEDAGLWRHAKTDPPGRLPGEFDPNAYFDVLKHLSMDDGLVLDFAYLYDSDGRPFLYARHKSAKPYGTFGEYDAALGGKWWAIQAQGRAILDQAHEDSSGKSWSEAYGEYEDLFRQQGEPMLGSRVVYDADKDFIEKVRADGCPESFFELVVLHELGGQFYLEWHFCCDDTRIIASREALDKLIAAHKTWSDAEGLAFTPEQAREAKRIDVRPRARFIDENTAEVSLVTFTKWGGFKRNTYRIRRSFPHTFIDIQPETLVEYDCGFVI